MRNGIWNLKYHNLLEDRGKLAMPIQREKIEREGAREQHWKKRVERVCEARYVYGTQKGKLNHSAGHLGRYS